MNKKKFFSISNYLLLLIFGMMCTIVNAQGIDGPKTAKDVVPLISRGINIGNALDAFPTEDSWGNRRTNESVFTLCKNAGFQCVRIPVTWDTHVGPTAPYTIDKAFLDRVEQVVDMGLSKGLYIILNAHHEKWLKAKKEKKIEDENSKRFYKIWDQIITRFSNKSYRLMFEIINEPMDEEVNLITDKVKHTPVPKTRVDEWNKAVYNRIRAHPRNQQRIVIYSGTGWSNFDDLQGAAKLTEPSVNPYIMGYYHSYDPSDFGLYLRDDKGKLKTVFDDSGVNDVKNKFAAVKKWSQDNGIPVILGEFGANEKQSIDERAKYYNCVVEQAIAYHIPFCAWDMKILMRGYPKGVDPKDVDPKQDWTAAWHPEGGVRVKDILINNSANKGLPQTIQAESYVASSGVQVEKTMDDGGTGLNVGFLDKNDFLSYTYNKIDIPADGLYTIEFRVASINDKGTITLTKPLDNTVISGFGNIRFPNTGGYQNWQTFRHTGNLKKGIQTFRLNIIEGGFNINWFRIVRATSAGSRESQNNSTAAAEGSNLELNSFIHNDILTVQLTGELSDVSLYSIDGKQLTAFSTKEVQKDIDMSKYTAGVYILKVSTAESNLTTKVIKK